jgi:plastocyanin
MKFSTASSVAIIAAFAPSLVSAANITVFVGASRDGQPGLRFDPQQIVAQRGDIVSFEFRGGNHTVTQSSFANPCAWQFNTATNSNGFNSGFIPYNQTTGQVGVYSLEVADPSTPIWFFCGRPPHCKGGMFGAINPPTTGNRTFEQFTANVQSTNEPGLGVTVPFTPPNASSSSSPSSGAAVPTNTNTNANNAPPSSNGAAATSNGAATPSSGAAAPSQSTSAAGSVTARSTLVLSLAGLAAGLIL